MVLDAWSGNVMIVMRRLKLLLYASVFSMKAYFAFRQDRIIKGRNRNTAWFSIVDDEWSELKNAYQQWLNPDNFDWQGIQKQKLSDFFD